VAAVGKTFSCDVSVTCTAKRIMIDKDNTTIVDGAGNPDAIKSRVGAIRPPDGS
jgi:hypothetical protein